ncbi:hypothetical protein ACFWPY_07950 [Streptomyces sp. NPDC058527]|uniref:hypothetical protein n=1 Tax=unclassified Streptomyces TaxID=2593676 RepID=UPI003656997C
MNRTAATLATSAAAALLALTACGTADNPPAKPSSKDGAEASTATATATADTKKAGIPPEPTGADRTALLDALRAVNPAIVAKEDKAIDRARNQCSAINGGSKTVDSVAQQRFSTGDHEVTAAEAKAINAALGPFCKTA